jgi:23S rRNA (cytosine1962-C5)-methyltransferase
VASSATVPKQHQPAILRRSPVVDASMLERVRGNPLVGDTVRLVAGDGEFLAWAVWTGEARFPARLVSWDPSDVLDASFFGARALAAVQRRLALPLTRTSNAYRVVFAESDGLPGVIADRYADWAILTLEGQALRDRLPVIAESIVGALSLAGAAVREEDSLRVLVGEAPPERVTIEEHGLRFVIDLRQGQKTGWFCDQRENRRHVARYATGRRVLDAFSYTGGFSVACLAAGATSVTLVDSSESALALASENLAPLGRADDATLLEGDAYDTLRALGRAGDRFGLVVLDPPKLLPPGAKREAAEQAYRSIQGLAGRLVEEGGILATFSCSGSMDRASFDRVVFEALGDRDARILERLGQPGDHPVLGSFRKSEYLKGLVLQLG